MPVLGCTTRFDTDTDHTTAEIATLLFEEGLSTAAKITEISGIGMAAAGNLIQQVGGSFAINVSESKENFVPFEFELCAIIGQDSPIKQL